MPVISDMSEKAFLIYEKNGENRKRFSFTGRKLLIMPLYQL
jgi:hypothetical protein